MGKYTLEGMEQPSQSTKKSKIQYLGVTSKMTEWSVCFQGKPFNITVIQDYAPTANVKEAEVESFYESLQDVLELTTKKRCTCHHRELEYKSRKSRDTWSNRQVWPWTTKWSSVCVCVCLCVSVCLCVCELLSHVWLYDPMDCGLPGSSVQGILQARVLEWIAIFFSKMKQSKG